MWNWIANQWEQVRGDFKFYMLTIAANGGLWIAGTVTAGLVLWQQMVLALVFVLIVSWAISATYLHRKASRGRTIVIPYHGQRELQRISGQRFVNDRVSLDGMSYRRCSFENVSFVYNGTAPFEFLSNRVIVSRGAIKMVTDNPAILTAASFLAGLGVAGPVGVFDSDGHPSPNIQPGEHGRGDATP